jgi:hypothetical protein
MRIQTKQQTASDRGQTRRSVNVLVSGFNRQSMARVDEISSTIDVLPTFHLAGLDQIVYDPGWETGSGFALRQTQCPRRSKAVFLRNERKILVFNFADLPELRHILYHEIGHHVFDRVLESALRRKRVTLINPHSRHVTRYAARNAIEDFAECYAVFVRDPKKLQKIHRKYIFIRDHVFAGIALNLEQGHIDMIV